MKIVGCDFHPAWQQVAVFDPETGEITEQKLLHGDGEAERFYRALEAPALVGIEACGNSQWFIELAEAAGPRSVGGGCGPDPGQLCAAAEDGPSRCGAHSEAADGEPVSAVMDADGRAAGFAPVADSPSQAGGDPDAGQERVAASGIEPWRAEEDPGYGAFGGGLIWKNFPWQVGRRGGAKIC